MFGFSSIKSDKPKPFVLAFEPKEDLTAFEHATILNEAGAMFTTLKFITCGTAEAYNDIRDRLGNAFRHFRLEDDESDEDRKAVRAVGDLMGRRLTADLVVEIAKRIRGAKA